MKVSRITTVFYYFFITLFVLLYLYQFYWVYAYAIDIPFWDEWEYFNPNELSSQLDWFWMFDKTANAHRLFLSKLQVSILYQIDGWNLRTEILLNYFHFGILFLVFFFCLKKTCIRSDSLKHNWLWVLPFMCFIFSPILSESHYFGMCSGIHFAMLFIFLTIYFVFSFDNGFFKLFLGAFFALCASLSMAFGAIATIICFLLYPFFYFGNKYFQPQKLTHLKLSHFIFIETLLALIIASWFIGGSGVPRAMIIWPIYLTYWTFFLNTVSNAAGLKNTSGILAFVSFSVIFFPLVFILKKVVTKYNTQLIQELLNLSFMIVSILAIMAIYLCISFTRASMGIEQSKSSHYAEIGIFLLPLCACLWIFILEHISHSDIKLNAKYFLIPMVFIFFAINFKDDWRYIIYHQRYRDRMIGVQCLMNHMKINPQGDNKEFQCPYLFHSDLRKLVLRAKELDISFTKSLH